MLFETISKLPIQGVFKIDIQKQGENPKRTAKLTVQFGSFMMNPPRNNIRYKTETLKDLKSYAIYVVEKNPSNKGERLEWMLLTNIPVETYEQAIEKIKWYCLRWKIEEFHKVLKSGFCVEKCRLGTASRLICYLTIMSILSWRILYMMLLSRTNPHLPCTVILTENEWKPLFFKMSRNQPCSNSPPTIKDVVNWIAQLGGFLNRNKDQEPGMIVIWRGWKRFFDIIDGYSLTTIFDTKNCG